jgi:hypothetical protein
MAETLQQMETSAKEREETINTYESSMIRWKIGYKTEQAEKEEDLENEYGEEGKEGKEDQDKLLVAGNMDGMT